MNQLFSKHPIAFCTLHPVSFLAAWILSFRRPVYFWRLKHVPISWTNRFQRIDPAQMYTLAQWQELEGRCYRRWSDMIDENKNRFPFEFSLDGKRFDYTNAWAQTLAIEGQSVLKFLALTQKLTNELATKQKKTVTCHPGDGFLLQRIKA